MTNTSFQEQIQKVEQLGDQLGHLLVCDQPALKHKNVLAQVEKLVRWADFYHRGLRYGLPEEKDSSGAWLAGVSDRLRLESGVIGDEEYDEPFMSAEASVTRMHVTHFIRSADHVIRMAVVA